MARSTKKQLPADSPILGVTYSARDKRILRVQLGRTHIVDIENHVVKDIVGRTKYRISKDDAEKLARRAKRWLKPPKGSIPIN